MTKEFIKNNFKCNTDLYSDFLHNLIGSNVKDHYFITKTNIRSAMFRLNLETHQSHPQFEVSHLKSVMSEFKGLFGAVHKSPVHMTPNLNMQLQSMMVKVNRTLLSAIRRIEKLKGKLEMSKDLIVDQVNNLKEIYGESITLGEILLEIKTKKYSPNYNDFYYFVADSGCIICEQWVDVQADHHRFKTENCFRTSEDASNKIKLDYVINDINNAIEIVNEGWQPDWSTKGDKYFIRYAALTDDFTVGYAKGEVDAKILRYCKSDVELRKIINANQDKLRYIFNV